MAMECAKLANHSLFSLVKTDVFLISVTTMIIAKVSASLAWLGTLSPSKGALLTSLTVFHIARLEHASTAPLDTLLSMGDVPAPASLIALQ